MTTRAPQKNKSHKSNTLLGRRLMIVQPLLATYRKPLYAELCTSFALVELFVAPVDKDAFFAGLDALVVPSRYESYSLVCAEVVARRAADLFTRPWVSGRAGSQGAEYSILDGMTPQAIAACLRDFEFRFEDALQTQVAARSRNAAEQLADAITRLVTG